MRRLAILLCLVIAPRVAWADDDSTKETARTLAYEGIELFERGEHAAALDKLERASSLVRAPTLALWRARALERLGRFVEAERAYSEAAGFELPEGADPALTEARDAAKTERAAIAARMPRIVVEVKGERAEAARVRVGERTVRPGDALALDPGDHRVSVVAGQQKTEQIVKLSPGETRRVVVELHDAVTPTGPRPPTPREHEPAGEGQRLAGWIALGVGGAGLLVGGGAGLWALAQRSELDGACGGGRCPDSERDAVDRYNATLTVSTLGFVIGAVGTAAGATLLLTAPTRSAPRVALTVQPSGLGVRSWW